MPSGSSPLSSDHHPPETQHATWPSMEIALIVILFLIGSVGGAVQALKYVERRQKDSQNKGDRNDKSPPL